MLTKEELILKIDTLSENSTLRELTTLAVKIYSFHIENLKNKVNKKIKNKGYNIKINTIIEFHPDIAISNLKESLKKQLYDYNEWGHLLLRGAIEKMLDIGDITKEEYQKLMSEIKNSE